MNLLSEIISKPVLNLFTGKIEGTIKNACFDKNYKKIQYFKMFDENEEEYLIQTNKICSCSNEAVVVKNNHAFVLTINKMQDNENNPILQNIFSIEGENKGKLTDIEFNNNFDIEYFVSSTQEKFKPNQIIIISENILINNTNKKINLSNFKPKIANNTLKTTNYIASILPKEVDTSPLPTSSEIKVLAPSIEKVENAEVDNKKPNFKIDKKPTPQKIIGDGNFLIGRKAIKTIYGLNNEIIIKKDNIINTKNLENAKKHSKLVELTVFSKIKV